MNRFAPRKWSITSREWKLCCSSVLMRRKPNQSSVGFVGCVGLWMRRCPIGLFQARKVLRKCGQLGDERDGADRPHGFSWFISAAQLRVTSPYKFWSLWEQSSASTPDPAQLVPRWHAVGLVPGASSERFQSIFEAFVLASMGTLSLLQFLSIQSHYTCGTTKTVTWLRTNFPCCLLTLRTY